MFLRPIFVLASLGASLSVVSAPVSTAPLQPTGNWIVDYGEVQCLAQRKYGTPGNDLILGIRPAPNNETYELIVARTARGPKFAEELKGAVDFGRGPVKAWLLEYQPPNSDLTLYQYRISTNDMHGAGSPDHVTFTIKGNPSLDFALTSVPALLKQLDACTADLQHFWNMGGETDGRISAPARGDVRNIFKSEDYPAEALYRAQTGESQFLLLIDERGKVAGCHLLKASGVPSLDAMGCQVLLKRAVFQPARDARGAPIRSTYVTPPIVWLLGG